jgi:hypothetical protein
MTRVILGLLLAGVTGCAMFDDYGYYGDEYVYGAAPTYAPQASGHAPHAPGRLPCGCSTGAAASAGMPAPPPSSPPPPPSNAYQPTGHVIPASASQSREPDLLNR